jgi:hypothetical protein
MEVNGCDTTAYDMGGNQLPNVPDSVWEAYPVPNNPGACYKMRNCPENFPLVVCPLPGTGHGSHNEQANPGFRMFFESFFAD